MKKLIKKSCLVPGTTSDSLKNRHAVDGTKKNLALLNLAERIWMSLDEVRSKRRRNFRYVFDDQWGDIVKDEKGHYVTERSRIIKRHGIALQNNHLFKIVTALTGLYDSSHSVPVCYARQENADIKSQMMTNAIQTNYELNDERDLLSNAMLEMICGGLPVLVEEWGCHDGIEDSYTYTVNPDYFFFRSKGGDPRMWDVDLVGEIRDYTLGELAAALARSEYDYKQLEAIYKPYISESNSITSIGDNINAMTFGTPPNTNLCRTYHIWTMEHKRMYRCYDPLDLEQPLFRLDLSDLSWLNNVNSQRLQEARRLGWSDDEAPLIEFREIVAQYWHFQILSPDGYVLTEYDSPYEHGSHPYIFLPHHYINGKIYPFIGVVIDQQRYINRLISLHDLAINNAAKGIKMIPTNVLGGMTPKAFAEQWTEIGGFIFYTPDPKLPNAVPQVVTTNATNIGTSELLQLEVEWINDLPNVSGSLQGKSPSPGTSASRYSMEYENSSTSVSSLFSRFNSFENKLAKKKMNTIHQYYNEPRNISYKHSSNYITYGLYDPKEVQDVQFMVSIKQSIETPVARMVINDLVKEMWSRGELSAKQMLKFGYFEGSEQIVQELEAQEELMSKQQAEGAQEIPQIPEEHMEKIRSNANQDVVNQVRRAIS